MKVLSVLVFTFWIEFNFVSAQDDWNYDNVGQWPGTCQTGKLQSPIDLTDDSCICSNFPPFVFKNFNGKPISGQLLNKDGHTVEIELEGEDLPKVSGGGLKGEHTLSAFHFHWGSEHTIDSERFDLEVHLVFYASQYGSLQSALTKNGVAVLATLFVVDDNPAFGNCLQGYTQSFNIIARNMPQISRNVNKKVPIKLPSLWDFVSPDLNDFYRYQGSLTTPNCTEEVTWTVFANPSCISSRNYNSIRNIIDKENNRVDRNFRPLQEINNRKILHNAYCYK